MKEIVVPKEIEFNIEFKLYNEIWIKYLMFLVSSLGIPEEYWK